MAYIRCGLTLCDAYYAEILLGNLYVGFLYSINRDQQVEDFCPTKIVSRHLQDAIIFRSECEGLEKVDFYKYRFSYKPDQLERMENVPEELRDAKDTDFLIFLTDRYINSTSEQPELDLQAT